MTETTLENRRAEVAQKLGTAPDQLHAITLELDFLRRQGILVDLNVTGVGMFTRTATWAEMGIAEDPDDPRFTRLTRGQKYLIPEEYVKRIRSTESRMRQHIEKYSRQVTGFHPYRWIPFTAYKEFRVRWDELKDEFYTLKAEIIEKRDDFVSEIAVSFREVADASFKAITAQDYQWVSLALRDGPRLFGREEFIAWVVNANAGLVPTAERIERELHADYITALVYGEQDAAADMARAEQIRVEADAARQEAYLQATILQNQHDHERRLQRMAEEERQAQLEAMRQAEIEHARQQLRQMVSPLQEVFVALREQMATDAQALLESVQRNGYVRGKVAEKGRGLLQIFDLMATHSDEKLRERLYELRQAIGPVGDARTDAADRNVEEIKGILEQIKELSHTAAVDLQAGPSRFSMIE